MAARKSHVVRAEGGRVGPDPIALANLRDAVLRWALERYDVSVDEKTGEQVWTLREGVTLRGVSTVSTGSGTEAVRA